ncbi:MAG: AAA family ATPase [Lewinellaceae bacterium]|nr:AAA family ATPase [Lewinellaceae bacterium]
MKKITIRNFGPIQNIEDLEIKDFMVFIGPQASGKSTVAKVVYFFKSVREELLKYLFGLLERERPVLMSPLRVFYNNLEAKLLDLFGPDILQNDIQLSFMYKEFYSLSITEKTGMLQGGLRFEKTMQDEAENLINKCLKYAVHKNKVSNGFPTQTERIIKEAELEAFKEELINDVNQLFGEEEEPLFIPAGRAVLTNLMEQLPFFETGSRIDLLTKEFAKQVLSVRPYFDKKNGLFVYENAARLKDKTISEFVDAAKNKTQVILKGEYRRENDKERIYLSSDKYVSLSHASSGQQESLWILMLILIRILDRSKIFIVIEEPEAHLFPDAQKEMVELIALFCNAQTDNKAVITTHSPYILTSLNNLLYAYRVGKNDPQGAKKVVDTPFWLDPSRVAAYFIENGQLEPIMDDGLIQAERIDEISNKLNIQLDQLYDLQST